MSKSGCEIYCPEIDFSGLDHIVIGSGIGGMTVATWLAKAGKKVALFESHSKPGGFTHIFKRKKGFQWDVGVHYVGGMNEGNSLRGLFDFLSDHKLKWEPMGEVYDLVYFGNEKYEFKAGKAHFRTQLLSYFPDDNIAIDHYLQLIEKLNKAANHFFIEKAFPSFLSNTLGRYMRHSFDQFSQKTTLQVLSELTTNQRLISVLSGQCGNYGLSPSKSSFAAHALIVGHFMEGGFYPVGGSEEIALTLIDNFNSLGGNVYVKAKVDEIVTHKNRVVGIRIKDKLIPCKSVISNAGVFNTFNKLLSPQASSHTKFDLKNVKSSIAHICLYVGLDQSDQALELPKHNIWYYENDDIDGIFSNFTLQNSAKKFAYISFPSAKDPQWHEQHPNTATIQALSAGNMDWFSAFSDHICMQSEEAYDNLKKAFEQNMLQRLYELLPQIKGHVIYTEVSTPLSTKHFSQYQQGEIYGLEHTPERFQLPFLRPITKIKGLKLVGQDTTLVGLSSAMLSGMICAITILKWRVWPIFREIAKKKKQL